MCITILAKKKRIKKLSAFASSICLPMFHPPLTLQKYVHTINDVYYNIYHAYCEKSNIISTIITLSNGSLKCITADHNLYEYNYDLSVIT
jgi:hypothetical protein